jgi:hypothetical protein
VALAICAGFVIDRLYLAQHQPLPPLVDAGCLISAMVGGFWPGLSATLLAVVGADYFFLEPTYSPFAQSDSQWFQLAIFAALGLAVSALGATVQRAIRGRTRLLESEQRGSTLAADGRRRYRELMEGLGVALYTTDVRQHNSSMRRRSSSGAPAGPDCDQWWRQRLYHADGSPMAHDECPMALT